MVQSDGESSERFNRGSSTAITRSDDSAQASMTSCSKESHGAASPEACESPVAGGPVPTFEAEHAVTAGDNLLVLASPAASSTGKSTEGTACKPKEEANDSEHEHKKLNPVERVHGTCQRSSASGTLGAVEQVPANTSALCEPDEGQKEDSKTTISNGYET
ncbi:hypothetical protein ON010_g17238 [Phytophthora cinnamomi]|nr:hypothetical protein ON010_g17238 [Phytophthora cinnamomi]